MYIDDSTVDLDGSNCFDNNTAKSEGGAIYARDGLIAFGGNDAFIANTAESKGAAIYTSLIHHFTLPREQLLCKQFSTIRWWNLL